MKKTFLLIIAALQLINCTHQNKSRLNDYSELVEINIDAKNGLTYPLDSLFTGNVLFVKLETNDENLIGEVSNIFFDDSLMFIVDKYNTKSIFIFDMNGNYISKISNFGNGPGEYSMIYNCFILKKEKRIVVVDTPQQKNISYSYSGDYISEEKSPFSIINCEYLESGNKVFYNSQFKQNDNHVLIITDKDNNIIYSACEEFKSDRFVMNEPFKFWKYGDELFFHPNFSDTLFVITDTVAIAKYCINVLHDRMPQPSEIENVTNDSFIENYLNKYPHFNGCFVELDNLTYLEISKLGYKIMYSHNTNNTYLFTDGNNALYHFFDTPISNYGKDIIVVPTWPTKIVSFRKFLYEDVRKVNERFQLNTIEVDKVFLDSLYYNLNEEDNPVLFFYELNTSL